MATAKSLVCGQCHAELKSMRAATEHAELTGHTDFAESTAPVVSMQCTACGKACDSKEEQTLHERHTGHTEFKAVESTLGKLPDKGPPTVDGELRAQLVGMGYSELRAEKALVGSGGATVDVAIDWLAEHAEDADLDTPWEVPPELKVPKAPLTEEERKEKARALQQRLKEQREKQAEAERQKELELEKRRREFGRQAQEILEQQRKQELQAQEYLRRKEKEADAKARARVQQGLQKDRAERGFQTKDLTAAQQKDHDDARLRALREEFKAFFLEMKASGEAQARVAAETMAVYLGNIVDNPGEPKYRRIKLSNTAFQSRVKAVPGALQYLERAGFRAEGEFLAVGEGDPETLQAARTELQVQLLYL